MDSVMPYVQFLGTESDYYFVSQIPALHGKPYVLTREEYTKKILTRPPLFLRANIFCTAKSKD